MKRIRTLSTLFLGLLASAPILWAQGFDLPKPGPEHTYLAQWKGCWSVDFSFRMQPGAEPQQSKGISWTRADLGGFWMIGDVEGKMMNFPYRGHAIQGYDPYKKVAVSVAIDNFGDYMVYGEGPLDMKAARVSAHGKMEMMGQSISFEQIIDMPDRDTQKVRLNVSTKQGDKLLQFTPMEMTLERIEGPDRHPGAFKPIKPLPMVKLTEEHEYLKKFAGTWDAQMEMMGMKSSGTMTWRLAYGGLWLIMDFEGSFAGMKFKGHGFQGYDSSKKKYVSAWVDSMAPSMMLSEGSIQDGEFVEIGTGIDPETGKAKQTKMVSTFRDEDTIDWQMFDIGEDGEEVPTMKITYKRRK